MFQFGGNHHPVTIIVPNGESAWIQFESRGWNPDRGFLIELGLQKLTGTPK